MANLVPSRRPFGPILGLSWNPLGALMWSFCQPLVLDNVDPSLMEAIVSTAECPGAGVAVRRGKKRLDKHMSAPLSPSNYL